MIRVLIVDDSLTQREFLAALLEAAGDFHVVGMARDGEEAVRKTESLRPDIILMDCHMPGTDGLEATRLIMRDCPMPIVIDSATLGQDVTKVSFEAIKSGALAVVLKPEGPNRPGHAKAVADLLQTLRLMSEVKVVGRRITKNPPRTNMAAGPQPRTINVIAICRSTGAPGVIAETISAIESPTTPPILVVQHLSKGFALRFAGWLDTKTTLRVSVATDDAQIKPGHVYLAPDDLQMGITSSGRIMLTIDPQEDGFRPSATYLFRSVAKAYGARAIGVLLTGMGCDGAAGLLAMRHAGALTMAQNEATCVVYGMPRVAREIGATSTMLSPANIAKQINSIRFGEMETSDVPLDQTSTV